MASSFVCKTRLRCRHAAYRGIISSEGYANYCHGSLSPWIHLRTNQKLATFIVLSCLNHALWNVPQKGIGAEMLIIYTWLPRDHSKEQNGHNEKTSSPSSWRPPARAAHPSTPLTGPTRGPSTRRGPKGSECRASLRERKNLPSTRTNTEGT